MPRIGATSTFSMSLIFAWLFSVAILEVAGLDAYAAATRLELKPIEGAPLLFTGIFVPAGFGRLRALGTERSAAEDGRDRVLCRSPPPYSWHYLCTARGVVWAARRKRRSKVSDDDPPRPEPTVQSLSLRRGGGRRANRIEHPLCASAQLEPGGHLVSAVRGASPRCRERDVAAPRVREDGRRERDGGVVRVVRDVDRTFRDGGVTGGAVRQRRHGQQRREEATDIAP